MTSHTSENIFVRNVVIGNGQPLCLISGPCVIENESHAMQTAEFLKKITERRPVGFIYKSSYDKANRSAFDSFRGPGLHEGLRILEKIQKEFDIPVVTDVHTPEEATAAGQVCDMIQIPAFLCRQTDLILAAGKTKAAVNVKKAQFMAPWEMHNVVKKLTSVGCSRILLTERGTTFGYNNLVTDMRSLPIMKGLGFPVCFDASHSVQLPGGRGTSSGGQREFIPTLTRAAIAAGADALFLESHPDPINAKSDKETVYPFDDLAQLLDQAIQLREVIKNFNV